MNNVVLTDATCLMDETKVRPFSARQLPDHEPPLLRLPMSFEQYWKLPEKPRSEWVDGMAVIHLMGEWLIHGLVLGNLIGVLYGTFPGLELLGPCGYRTKNAMWVPDMMAVKPPITTDYIVDPPVLIIEILSPVTREWDLVTKANAYLKEGVQQYWTIDTDSKKITVRKNANDQWNVIATVDAEHPEVTVTIGDYGSIELDLKKVFRR